MVGGEELEAGARSAQLWSFVLSVSFCSLFATAQVVESGSELRVERERKRSANVIRVNPCSSVVGHVHRQFRVSGAEFRVGVFGLFGPVGSLGSLGSFGAFGARAVQITL